MRSESRKQSGQKDARAERRERLARELRANLLKRKALARARRAQARDAEQEPEQVS
ncbi:MAG: hypothetical protein DIU57_000820 [Pseudomonadota bacterium]|jgi:hypothetical protein